METTSQDSQVIMGRYRLGRLLGRGTFAKVYKAHKVATGEVVAIKVFDKESVQLSGTMEQVKREVNVMRRVHHRHIIRLHEVMATRSRIYFVMEYAGGGELFTRLSRSPRFPEPVARRYFQQLITAVEFCHSRGVYHRDLKPENLLLDARGDLKVTDFGLSALDGGGGPDRLRGDGLLHTTCGTPAYVAPEVLLKRGYDGAKADIWSCGVILFVLLAGYLPFNETNLVILYRNITGSNYRCPPWFSVEARKLLARLLDPNPKTRITISKIMDRPWFQKGTCPLGDMALVASAPSVLLARREASQQHEDDEDGFAREKKRSKVTMSSPAIDVRPPSMNAFDIISRSSGLDLSKMFDAEERRSEARFSTRETTTAIVSKLEEIAEAGRFSFKLKEKGRVELEGSQDGRKGALAIEAEIFKVAPEVHVVEVRKTGGDSPDFRDFYKQELKPSLGDMVWAWQGGDSPPPPPLVPAAGRRPITKLLC
uniref:non-specific serine/threonine protein kinase n=1 Tax=Oryza punctata TaxID=4537 RepID=A0A0E0JNY5_ORYPU